MEKMWEKYQSGKADVYCTLKKICNNVNLQAKNKH